MKKRGSISILLLFVFLLISLSFLFLMTQLEQRILITDTVFDRSQSSYVGESIAYQYLTELDLADYFEQLQRAGSQVSLPKQSALEGTTQSATLKSVKEENQFNSFLLELTTTYEGIMSTTFVHGRWIDPVFYQVDGYLTRDEIKIDKLIEALGKNFEDRDIVFLNKFHVVDPMELEFSKGNIHLYSSEAIDSETTPISLNRSPNAIVVENTLKIKNRGTVEGLVRVKSGATLQGDFHVKGVVILEPGAKSYGKIDVHGLCIDLGGETEGIYSVFSKEETIKYLRYLEGFINPQVISLEKH